MKVATVCEGDCATGCVKGVVEVRRAERARRRVLFTFHQGRVYVAPMAGGCR